MPTFTIIASGIILAVAVGIAFMPRGASRNTALGALFAVSFLASCLFPLIGLQGLLHVLALVCLADQSLRLRTTLQGLAVGISWGLVVFMYYSELRKEDDTREKFAFKSLDDRIPRGKSIRASTPLSHQAASRLEKLESELETNSGRSNLLKRLHDRTTTTFVNSPGFGPQRGIRSTEHWLILPETPAITQPGSPAVFPISSGEPVPSSLPQEGNWLELHQESFGDFLNPEGFGYVLDRKRVAGFQAHGFRKVPESRHAWKIQNILLVGFLAHEQPTVYLSEHLPSMEQLRKATTRGLDRFEEVGLKSLRDGEDLYTIQKDDSLRMLGALRATKQCLKCHDAERGDMLGAFSYTLRRVDKKD